MVVELSRALPLSVGHGLTVTVVGCGYWGSKHVRVLSTLPSVTEVIVADPDDSARASIAAAFPNVRTSADVAAAIDSADAVVVATPPSTHADVALYAVRAGKHVLIEKPLAKSLAEARLLVSEAMRHGATLMVGHTFEFNSAVRELRRRMDAGELGEIRYIHSARLNLGLYRSDVNVVWDLAPHDVSIMNYLLRSTPSVVRAWGSANANPKVADLAYFQLDYRDRNVVGYGHVSWLDPHKVRQVTVVGSRKMAVYDDLAEERLRIYDRGVEQGQRDEEEPANGAAFQVPMTYRYGDIVSPYIDFQEPLKVEDQHFIDCVLNSGVPVCDGENGIAVMATLEAIDRALTTGRSTDVDRGPAAAPLVSVVSRHRG